MVPRCIIIAICLIPIAGTTCAGDLPDAARVIDSDMVWDFRAPDSFALSPDQSQVVYISRGALWVAKVATGPATKLMDLPNTLTEFMATDRYREDRKYFNRAGVAINDSKFRDRPDDNLTKVFGLKWNRNGIYFALAKGSRNRPWTVTYRIMAVSADGRAEEVTTIVRDTFDEFHRLAAFDVTGDESMVVVSDGYRPLICDTATGKPKATSFDWLTASATSGRFIGVEIDTREIVVTNPSLEVVKRTGVMLPGNGFCELLWSPDERFVISKFHHREGPQRDRAEGHRLNLVTLERTQLQGDCRRDHLAFTGNGGEFIRTGANEIAIGRRVDGGDGTTVLVVADGDGPTTVVHTFTHRFPRADRVGIEKPYPPVAFNRSGTLFAMALPREGEASSYCYSLMNREGQQWPLEPDDFTRYISPYHVLAITGEYLLATDDIHLFSIPLPSLQNQP